MNRHSFKFATLICRNIITTIFRNFLDENWVRNSNRMRKTILIIFWQIIVFNIKILFAFGGEGRTKYCK
jgi:hypothetical protein